MPGALHRASPVTWVNADAGATSVVAACGCGCGGMGGTFVLFDDFPSLSCSLGFGLGPQDNIYSGKNAIAPVHSACLIRTAAALNFKLDAEFEIGPSILVGFSSSRPCFGRFQLLSTLFW